MGYVHCPFCGARVAVGSDGSVEPKCPRCGAWAVTRAHAAADGPAAEGALAAGTLGATMALELRGLEGPEGPISFVRAPYGGAEDM